MLGVGKCPAHPWQVFSIFINKSGQYCHFFQSLFFLRQEKEKPPFSEDNRTILILYKYNTKLHNHKVLPLFEPKRVIACVTIHPHLHKLLVRQLVQLTRFSFLSINFSYIFSLDEQGGNTSLVLFAVGV